MGDRLSRLEQHVVLHGAARVQGQTQPLSFPEAGPQTGVVHGVASLSFFLLFLIFPSIGMLPLRILFSTCRYSQRLACIRLRALFFLADHTAET